MRGLEEFEVVIIGGGPAGSAAAISLAKQARCVALVERKGGETFKIGEGLPPSARPLLMKLGVWEQFNAEGHLPSYGNDSAWGSADLQSTDFIRSPYGHGWHVDRPRFDAMLRAAARQRGAKVYESARVTKFIKDRGGNWLVSLAGIDGTNHLRARWLVDCTGRAGSIARSQGVMRISYDRLLGFVALFSSEEDSDSDSDFTTLIEAAPNGWWYTALIPFGRRVAVYFTDSGSQSSTGARTAEGYLDLLNQTEHIRARLTTRGYKMTASPQTVSANSARLERVTGDGWVAAGDAATSFDPLSSQGMLAAMSSGLKTGNALHENMSGDPDALDRYSRDTDSIYDAYLNNRTLYYGYERRWANDEFWLSRQQNRRTT